MRNRALTAAVACAAAVLAAACDGKGATGPSDSQLTAADAASLNRALFATGASFAGGSVPSGARGARLTTASGAGSFSFAFNTTQPCSPSGNVGLSGTLAGAYDPQAQTAQVQANVAVQHQRCAVKTENGGTFTLNGDPKIDVGLNAAGNATGLTGFHLTETGAFTWDRGDGNSGRCTVDVTGDLVGGTQTVKLTGSFCGFPIDQTVPANG